jgi:hypothetical protein
MQHEGVWGVFELDGGFHPHGDETGRGRGDAHQASSPSAFSEQPGLATTTNTSSDEQTVIKKPGVVPGSVLG